MIDTMIDFKKQAQDILDFWDKNAIFSKSIAKPARHGDYVFYDGPPFATGTPHYGHFAAGIIKDVIPRYFTMQGYRVKRRWGWDCHGLPIENIIEKDLKFKTKKDIEKYGVDKFNEACRARVLEYADLWKKTMRELGRWADMENAYRTMDTDYMESVWRVFKTLWDKDLIYKDYRSMHVCPRCETTLSQSEVAEGYKDIKDLSLIAKFELVDEPGVYVLAWTTTPWTLIGNVALAVGKDIKYAQVEADGVKYILASDLISKVLPDKQVKVQKEFKGSDLFGKKYKPLFDYYYEEGNGWKIYDADFVSTEEGTGVVHIAPAFGEDDMNLGKSENLPFIQHVGIDGVIKPEAKDFAGLNVKPRDDVQSTDVAVIKYLAGKNLLFDKKQYEHSYPHCWRCDTPLLNYATSSWFVKVTKIKDQALKIAKDINWMPEHIKEGRFGKWLEGARDWSISRQRYWASCLPIWECSSCDNRQVFGSIAELAKAAGETVTDLHKHILDKVTFACPKCKTGTMQRIPDVMDCWFESGSMPYAAGHQFPAQFIAEGVDQTRTWFYYMHVIATAIKGSPAFKNVIVNGIVLAEDGKKMSKKLRNYPEPEIVMAKYSADALRLYLLSSPVMLAENFSFVEKDLETVYRRFTALLQNIVNFYQMFVDAKLSGEELPKLDNDLDKWIVSKYYLLLSEVTDSMHSYNLVKATRPLVDFVDSLSTWYIRRSRDRFKGDDKKDKDQAVLTLAFVLKQFSKVIAPFTPMTAETLYQVFENQEESVHLEDWPKINNKMIDQKILVDMDKVREIAEKAHALRAENKIKVRQPLASLKTTAKLDKAYLEILQDELNVEIVTVVDKLPDNLELSLDTNLTQDLKDKGVVREIVRQINSLRKDAGLKPSDNPVETYQTDSKYLQDIVEKFKTEITASTSAKILEQVVENPKHFKELDIDGQKIILGLKL